MPIHRKHMHYICSQPTTLMRELVRAAAAGALVLDPFAASGTTLLAAALTGRRAIGIEREEADCEIAADRLRKALAGDAPRPSKRRTPRAVELAA